MGDGLDTVFVSFFQYYTNPPNTSPLEWIFTHFDKDKTKIMLTTIFFWGSASYRTIFGDAAQRIYLERCKTEKFRAEVLIPQAMDTKDIMLELLTKHGMKKFVVHTDYMSQVSSAFVGNPNASCKIWFIPYSNSKIDSIWKFGPDVQDTEKELKKKDEKLTEQIKINEQLKESLTLGTYVTSQELEDATQNFSDSLKIGEGGSGSVYKATFRGTTVAIKKLKCQNEQALADFRKEVVILSTVRHPNLVTLMGACSDPPTLVYEYLSNESLHDHLTHTGVPLLWQNRTRIISEICLALIYLHSNKPTPVVHGDLKPDNVFLDANFTSKLTDFGLIKQAYMNNANLFRTTDPERTFAYMDPRFLKTGKMTIESDVYSFGVIILRLITGKTPLDIRDTVEESMENNQFSTMIDESAGKWPLDHAKKMADMGIRCAHDSWTKRPHLVNEVWPIIEGLLKFPEEAI